MLLLRCLCVCRYLQHAHAERLSEDLVRLLVEAVPDVRGGHEQLERILRRLLLRLDASRDLALDLAHALLTVRREAQILLVTPQHRGPCAHGGLGQHVVQVDHLVSPVVSHNEHERAVLGGYAILDERADARIHFLLHHGFRGEAGLEHTMQQADAEDLVNTNSESGQLAVMSLPHRCLLPLP